MPLPCGKQTAARIVSDGSRGRRVLASRGSPGAAARMVVRAGLGDMLEVDLPLGGIHPHQPDPELVADREPKPGAIADQRAVGFVEVEIVSWQRGDVHEAIDLHRLQLHKQSEIGDAGHDRVKLFADARTHVLALEPGDHGACRLVRAPFTQ